MKFPINSLVFVNDNIGQVTNFRTMNQNHWYLVVFPDGSSGWYLEKNLSEGT